VRLVVVVDSRIWLPIGLPAKFVADLKKRFVHPNPDFFRKRGMGFATWGTPQKISTWEEREDSLGKRVTLPRGGAKKLRAACDEAGFELRWMDRSISSPVRFDGFVVDPKDPSKVLYDYQIAAVDLALEKRQGIIRAPTGSGKTAAALSLIQRAGERTLVVVRDRNLLSQWKRTASGSLSIPDREIGEIGGGKFRPGSRLTIALQQSLYAKGNRLEELLRQHSFGMTIVDEVQTVAARTFQEVVDRVPSRYRIGFSADETRRDKMEFLVYDAMGDVLFEITRAQVEARGTVVPVTARVVSTQFRADWYRDASPAERDFTRLVEEMSDDDERNDRLFRLVEELLERDEGPILIFTHRREHAERVADLELSVRRRIPCGLLLGGGADDQRRFQEDLVKFRDGKIKVAIGTYKALGTGHDIPNVAAGICATPISDKNKQFFNQVRGRLARSHPGKARAFGYYLHDVAVFPRQVKALQSWNDGDVETFERGEWKPAR